MRQMKFLNAALTAALAGLSLLAPTAYGRRYLECNSGEIFPFSQIREYGMDASLDFTREGDPDPPTGEWFGVYRFTSPAKDGRIIDYLVQSFSDYPYFTLHEFTGTKWEKCVLKGSYLDATEPL
ncbi:BgTH12-05461 [Blumeria graminis f. sp. triticale]|uniref:BgTH12-05461 n=1 Tax=Blumeria graminis f. sp. triticale TaxID=1689686 RepID=A0A9W4D2T2_BLUGR|nr:BgTH12-05461 [Blumeria graminis f. sp. triticale]